MAHHKSAIKRIKQNEKRNARNRHRKSTLKTYIKRVREAVENKDKTAALEALAAAIPVIDKTASKGVIHKATASRNVSRLTKLVNTLA
ncbi:30S ribosomal protein S20 [Trichlorobacter ammonificans]|uniref:Small ribosomal subunit protein bS20 n=1 Tax=Trichlorobacter ammonificans TaxID=2916410 RepID=A0ABM9D751_9BACT|nr:30S ribosomal protein S20 [Trichlorobacter ammonificans]CAH2031057.1 30S ribosomal protein S20 [Trichlorobacter ammonificans]